MKLTILIVLVSILSLVQGHPQGRPGGGPAAGGLGAAPPGAPRLSATFSRLFGDHKAFSAAVLVEMTQGTGGSALSTPCKLAYLEGKSRMEFDLTQSKGAQIPAGMGEQLKAMGMSELVMIAHEAAGVSYMVYPGLRSYAEVPSPEGKVVESDVKVEVTELGKESLDGHPCVKNKVLITDGRGKPLEATVWNASDLKKFPVRIETVDSKATLRMNLKDVKFDKPDAKLFEPPAGFTRYEGFQAMMQDMIMKRMSGGQKPGQ